MLWSIRYTIRYTYRYTTHRKGELGASLHADEYGVYCYDIRTLPLMLLFAFCCLSLILHHTVVQCFVTCFAAAHLLAYAVCEVTHATVGLIQGLRGSSRVGGVVHSLFFFFFFCFLSPDCPRFQTLYVSKGLACPLSSCSVMGV